MVWRDVAVCRACSRLSTGSESRFLSGFTDDAQGCNRGVISPVGYTGVHWTTYTWVMIPYDIRECLDMKSVICRPLIVVGKGAAQAHADSLIRQLADKVQIPVLSTSMGRGVVPDDHPLSVIAARSLALAKADVVLVLGAR